MVYINKLTVVKMEISNYNHPMTLVKYIGDTDWTELDI